jgi:putative hydrolase of the HAD superfamily
MAPATNVHRAHPTHLFFDFFGTLNHYNPSVSAQGCPRTYRLLQELGVPLDYATFLDRWQANFEEFEATAIRTAVEYSMDNVCAQFLRTVLCRTPAQAHIDALREVFLDEWSAGIAEIDGLQLLIELLAQRYSLTLISNTHYAPFVHARLRRMGIDACFGHVVTSSEHGRRKPSACIFERAIALNRASRGQCLHVGDSYEADYLGAAAAGVECLLIDPEQRHPVPQDRRINDVRELGTRLLSGDRTASTPMRGSATSR